MKVFQRIFFALYIPIGLWASLNVGTSMDEPTEYQTLLINIDAVKGLISGNFSQYQSLLNYSDRYYGIGFHLISHFVTQAFTWINQNSFIVFTEVSEARFRHIPVFISYVLSGILVKSILSKMIDKPLVASLGMMVYLLWPYLLGHAFMNVKDIPFLFVWLLATNTYLNILQFWQSSTVLVGKNISTQFIFLGVLTAWLLSIRVSGLLIFIEYVVFFITYHKLGGCKLWRIITVKNVVLFLTFFLIPLFILHPVFWHNPFEFINAIKYMSQHPWDGNTLTAGTFLSPKQLTFLYIPAWLMVKLPVFILIGWLVLVFLAIRSNDQFRKYLPVLVRCNLLGLVLTIFATLLFLVVIRAGLYNELRQILFLLPLIFIVGFVGLYYFSSRLLLMLLATTGVFFLADNFALYPYQYTYFNEVARQTNLSSRYEKDYFALSVSPNAKWLNQQDFREFDLGCLIASPTHLWDDLNKSKYPCISGYQDFASIEKPFVFYWLIRDRTDLLPLPYCKLIHEEKVGLPFSRLQLVMSQLFLCEPVNKK